MKKNITASAFIFPLVFAIVSIGVPVSAFAATTPSLGAATTYDILSSTYTNTSAGTVVNGDVGFTTPPAVAPLGTHANYGSGSPYAIAGTDSLNALSALSSQPCTFTFAPGAINLSTDTTHGPVGVYTPGVYCSAGAMSVGGPLTLGGNGTFIFRPDGALTSVAGAAVSLNGASACNVFWTPTQATTLGANTTFTGTVLSSAGITVGANTTWTGRSLAFGGTVTTDTTTISVPQCSSVVPAPVVITATTTTNVLIPVVSTTTVVAVVATTTTAVATTSVLVPVPSTPVTSVPLALMPYTGLGVGDNMLWYFFHLVLPSLVFAFAASLYLFRTKLS